VTDIAPDRDVPYFVDTVDVLHQNGQDALTELELATLDMGADKKWMLEDDS
jgi:hypothetical protein